jgi:hypothetical protein
MFKKNIMTMKVGSAAFWMLNYFLHQMTALFVLSIASIGVDLALEVIVTTCSRNFVNHSSNGRV